MIEITAKELKKVVRREIKNRSWFGRLPLEMRDKRYRLYSFTEIVEAVRLIQQPHKFDNDFWDCDDIADYLIVMLKVKFPGIAVSYIKAQNDLMAHGFVGVVTEDKAMMFFKGNIMRFPKIKKIRF